MMRLMMPTLLLLASLAAPAVAEPSAGPSAPLADDGEAASLLEALERARAYLEAIKQPTLRLGEQALSVERVRRSLARFEALVRTDWGTPRFEASVRAEFDWVAMPGQNAAGAVHFTGYHLPLMEARERPDATFRFPLYATPPDLVGVDLGSFRPALAGQTLLGRVQDGRLVPYPARAAIDDGGALAGRGLEIAWVADELGRYQLMIQGSGLLRFADGHVENVNYAAQNGQPYVSLGKTLVADGKIPADRIAMPTIEAYCRAHPAELRSTLNRNPSYVFFRRQPDGPFGSSGITLTPGRAMATDKRLFPAGLLAYLEYPRARFDAAGAVTGWEPGSRFVVDLDTGGAIVGPGRIDMYWGGGEEAARRAGTLNGKGKAYFLLLKAGVDHRPVGEAPPGP